MFCELVTVILWYELNPRVHCAFGNVFIESGLKMIQFKIQLKTKSLGTCWQEESSWVDGCPLCEPSCNHPRQHHHHRRHQHHRRLTIVIIMILLIELMVAPSVNPLVQKLPWNAVPRPPICNIPSSSPISFIIIIFAINVTRPKQ